MIAIVKDFDGHEICLVSSETFDKAAKEAHAFMHLRAHVHARARIHAHAHWWVQACDWKDPDWDQRRAFIDERSAKSKKGLSS